MLEIISRQYSKKILLVTPGVRIQMQSLLNEYCTAPPTDINPGNPPNIYLRETKLIIHCIPVDNHR